MLARPERWFYWDSLTHPLILSQEGKFEFPSNGGASGGYEYFSKIKSYFGQVLSTLIKELKALSTSLSSVITPPAGTPLIQINVAGNELYTALENITTSTNNFKKLKSTKSYTV